MYESLEKALINGGFENEEEALAFAEERAQSIEDGEELSRSMVDGSPSLNASAMYQVNEQIGDQE